jgi:serine/threonine protein phosphatase PrpC
LGQPRQAEDVDVSDGETAPACRTCGASLLAEDRYCERCGTRVRTAPEVDRSDHGCSACGAPPEAIGVDRYCSRCGVRQRGADRREIDLAVAGGVSDRGRVRRRNEDALYMQRVGESSVVAVVCDGISSSLSPDVAASLAADAGGQVLAAALLDGTSTLASATTDAIRAAQQAVLEVPWTSRSDLDYPSCTLVSAACRNDELNVGWVGDSRAYWIAGESSCQLTVDDSWAQEQVGAGLLSAQEADADSRAHTITRWLGRDAPDQDPQLVTIRPTESGRLVLCSDGLWNYAPDAATIAALLDGLPSGAAPIAAARALADNALGAGGHDNITVAVLNVAHVKGEQ